MKRYKFPSIPHLPYSNSITTDDITVMELPNWDVVVTEKLDGQTICMTRDFIHARSIEDLPRAPYNDNIKRIWSELRWNIPEEYYLFGEDVSVKHSVYYNSLPSPFMVFGLMVNKRFWAWDNVKNWCEQVRLATAPELYRGVFDRSLIHQAWKPQCGDESEGYVIRPLGNFGFDYIGKYVQKYVRANHVQNKVHWTRPPFIYNKEQ